MLRFRVVSSFAALLVVGLIGPVKGTDCLQVTTSAPYRNMGYDHIVHLSNACDAPLNCRVSTSVSPEVVAVVVPGHGSVDVLTFRGSPAYQFTPHVVCER